MESMRWIFAGFFIVLYLGMPRDALADEPTSGRYGPFNLLDHRSRYGDYWFPEPLRVDEVDVDNEVRLDWQHDEGNGRVADEVRFELEKSFNLLTLELELPYSRETELRDFDAGGGNDTAEGLGNIALAARHPIFQYVSPNEFFDDTT